jgi:hypothetical protein
MSQVSGVSSLKKKGSRTQTGFGHAVFLIQYQRVDFTQELG